MPPPPCHVFAYVCANARTRVLKKLDFFHSAFFHLFKSVFLNTAQRSNKAQHAERFIHWIVSLCPNFE